ncbi:hypothetical protein SAMN04487897_11049 [Paenibacillus sp. yr247]|nr:hypothetical protein [Paenibacillus sp. yr247]SDO22887.1 hypothetical protein SAMN04487897_11049 [Paenibacillus sp. yr247]
MLNGKEVAAEATANRYRQGGLRIRAQYLNNLLNEEANAIDVYV